MKNFKSLRKELLKKPAVKKEYDQLKSEYSLIAQLIQKRLDKKLTQKQLAQKIGTKQSAISRLESGSYNPSIVFLQKIAQAFDSQLSIQFQ